MPKRLIFGREPQALTMPEPRVPRNLPSNFSVREILELVRERWRDPFVFVVAAFFLVIGLGIGAANWASFIKTVREWLPGPPLVCTPKLEWGVERTDFETRYAPIDAIRIVKTVTVTPLEESPYELRFVAPGGDMLDFQAIRVSGESDKRDRLRQLNPSGIERVLYNPVGIVVLVYVAKIGGQFQVEVSPKCLKQ